MQEKCFRTDIKKTKANLAISKLMTEYAQSSSGSSGSSAVKLNDDDIENETPFDSMTLEEQEDYENPIEAFQKGKTKTQCRSSTANSASTKVDSNSGDEESYDPEEIASATINIRDSIVQGSFLPVIVMA